MELTFSDKLSLMESLINRHSTLGKPKGIPILTREPSGIPSSFILFQCTEQAYIKLTHTLTKDGLEYDPKSSFRWTELGLASYGRPIIMRASDPSDQIWGRIAILDKDPITKKLIAKGDPIDFQDESLTLIAQSTFI